ncbi:MAG: signal peptidase II [Desulfobacterales bacterium C00003106]|nr:MAG: signal peptidase II [Desulfobacterales bacterium C00003106]OEU60101.1 MAG: signal peptidase II [Desulfobacterales bacterium C00003104]
MLINHRYVVLCAGSTLIALLDQIVKLLVRRNLVLYQPVEVIPGFFNLTYLRNRGGAFGLFSDAPDFMMAVFIGGSLLATGMIVYIYSRVQPGQYGVSAALIMILGGAAGNLIDRVFFGQVVDFLDFYVGTMHWPAFNVADSFITVGVGLFCYYALIKKVPV